MHLRLLFFCLLFPVMLSAQIRSDISVFDHGKLESFNNDTAWFQIRNEGSGRAFLLPTQPSGEYKILSSANSLEPGGEMRLGIVYYTGQKGPFKIQVPVHFSNSRQPLVLTVRGDIRKIRETAFNTCPSIENSVPLQNKQVPLGIRVMDADSRERLRGVKISVHHPQKISHAVPDLSGLSYRCNTQYGRLRVQASKPGYKDSQTYFVYNENNYSLLLFLKRLPEAEETKDSFLDQVQTETGPENGESEIPVYIPVALADSGFASARYKPNHLIFIIDVSGSMRDSFKLNYLKRAMKELISSIRPQDHISLITYTSRARVVFENISGSDRSALLYAIDTLKAGGGSNGSKSLLLATELARRYKIEGGNNQILIATDGLLNSSSMSNEDLYRLAARAWRQDGILTSSIGFGFDNAAIDFLQKLARAGRGNFLRITDPDRDIRVLLDEVKSQSLARP